MSTPTGKPLPLLGRWSKGFVVFLLFYWGAFALLAPVTTWDSQVYNLGRLPIAELSGLFNNPLWTSQRQLIFPWTFDAIHLIFLHLGWGFGIPSYFCLVGILVVAWSLLQRWHDETTAWVGCLALMGLPTLVFQSVGTKNDIPILFGIAVWLHALIAWRQSQRTYHLVLCACALAFAAGVKTSGIIPAGICIFITLVLFRRRFATALRFTAVLLAALMVLGSVETYVESYRQFGSLLGPSDFVSAHRNNDGIRGAVANGVRYAMGNLNFGVEVWENPDRITPYLEKTCRHFLAATSLADSGYRKYDFNDVRMQFLKTEDSSTDFGPLGTLCVLLLFATLLWWRPGELWWRLGVFAGIVAASICLTIAWMPWNDRFLLLPFACLTLALVSLASRYTSTTRRWPLLIVAIISIYAAVTYPLLSFNKRPRDLVASIFHRQTQEFKERPAMESILAAIQARHSQNPAQRIWLLSGTDSWVLPFLADRKLNIAIVSLSKLAADLKKIGPTEIPPLLLVLNRPDFRVAFLPLKQIQRFPQEDATWLYEYRNPTSAAKAPSLIPRLNCYDDGWTGCAFVIEVADWPSAPVIMEIGNPTSLRRQVIFQTSIEEVRLELAPGEHQAVQLKVKSNDSITGSVTPAYIPGGADPRRLGIHLGGIAP